MIRSSIRAKLITGFTVAIVVQAAITCIVGVRLFYDRILVQAQGEVTAALNSAREIYWGQLREIHSTVRLSATRRMLIESLTKGDRAAFTQELDQIRRAEKLDILTITDAQGRVVCRSRNPNRHGDNASTNPLVQDVLTSPRAVLGTVIVPCEELLAEDPALAERAHIEFVETAGAKPTSKSAESAGMMLAAAAPVFDRDGVRLLGVLYGGTLLNRNYAIVDKIKQVVFFEKIYRKGNLNRDIGTATIFQGDLRISTNVQRTDGSRAIGTRVWSEVHDAVLVNGRQWSDEAFVVNDWYITAYEPIRDPRGKIIGILYVGILKRPFIDSFWQSLWIFIGIALLGILLVILIAVIIAQRLTRRLRTMARLAEGVAEGYYEGEIQVDSKDEVGRLAESFNTMTKRLSQVMGELRDWARSTGHWPGDPCNWKAVNSPAKRRSKAISVLSLAAAPRCSSYSP